MVASNHRRIRCAVVAVPVGTGRLATRETRARDLLPWADPYIVSLIHKLQDEVRRERLLEPRTQISRGTAGEAWELDPHADLDIPWNDPPEEVEPWDDDRRWQWEAETDDTRI